jgi:replicative DNA helicase
MTEKRPHYLIKKLNDLPAEERAKVKAEILADATSVPKTKLDKYVVSSMMDYVDDARERLAHWGKMQGLSTGYPSIDKLTMGLVGGELVVIAGKTSYGKTTLAMNIANKVALANHRILFVTLEMTHVELTSRYMFINGGESEDFSLVAANTLFQENDELDWQDIDGLIENAKRELDVDLVIIDHLHYFTRELENVSEDLGRITKELKKNAKRHDIPVILISHVRKTQSNVAATMDDLRGTSYIAQDADIVLMVGRNEENHMVVKIEKNRNRGFDYTDDTVTLDNHATKIVDRQDPNALNEMARNERLDIPDFPIDEQ